MSPPYKPKLRARILRPENNREASNPTSKLSLTAIDPARPELPQIQTESLQRAAGQPALVRQVLSVLFQKRL